jgi:hypothetical protein
MIRAAGALIAGVVFAAGFVATLSDDGSLRYPMSYSQTLIAAIAVLFLASAAMDWREARAARGPVVARSVAGRDMPGGPVILWATIALCLAYAASWTLVGFFPATFVYVAAQLWLLRQRHWMFLLGVPAAVTVLVYVVFAVLLTLPFPGGFWTDR